MTRRAVNSVSHDNIGGIYAAVNHLWELGHTRIGYIRLMSGAIGDERYETYVNTLSKKVYRLCVVGTIRMNTTL